MSIYARENYKNISKIYGALHAHSRNIKGSVITIF